MLRLIRKLAADFRVIVSTEASPDMMQFVVPALNNLATIEEKKVDTAFQVLTEVRRCSFFGPVRFWVANHCLYLFILCVAPSFCWNV